MPDEPIRKDDGKGGRPPVLLVVDDDADIVLSISAVLRRYMRRAQVVTASSADEALAAVEKQRVDVVLSDFRMPGRNGLDLVTRLRARDPRVVLLMMTAYPTLSLQVQGLKDAGIDGFFSKPFEARQMVDKIEGLLLAKA